MHFSQHMVDRLRKLADDERFAYFFHAASEKPEDEEAVELIDDLASILVAELKIPWETLDKVRYFMWLGYHAHK